MIPDYILDLPKWHPNSPKSPEQKEEDRLYDLERSLREFKYNKLIEENKKNRQKAALKKHEQEEKRHKEWERKERNRKENQLREKLKNTNKLLLDSNQKLQETAEKLQETAEKLQDIIEDGENKKEDILGILGRFDSPKIYHGGFSGESIFVGPCLVYKGYNTTACGTADEIYAKEGEIAVCVFRGSPSVFARWIVGSKDQCLVYLLKEKIAAEGDRVKFNYYCDLMYRI